MTNDYSIKYNVNRKESKMVKDILEKHGVYSIELEVDLLRHFDKLQLEVLNTETQISITFANIPYNAFCHVQPTMMKP